MIHRVGVGVGRVIGRGGLPKRHSPSQNLAKVWNPPWRIAAAAQQELRPSGCNPQILAAETVPVPFFVLRPRGQGIGEARLDDARLAARAGVPDLSGRWNPTSWGLQRLLCSRSRTLAQVQWLQGVRIQSSAVKLANSKLVMCPPNTAKLVMCPPNTGCVPRIPKSDPPYGGRSRMRRTAERGLAIWM